MEAANILSYMLTVIFFIVTIFAYFSLRRNPRVKEHLNKIGGPETLPFLGNAWQLMGSNLQTFAAFGSWFEEFGTTYRMWITNLIPYVVTCDVNVVEKVIYGTSYLDKGKNDYSLLLDWLGTGLLTAPAGRWAKLRKLLTPIFHFKILENFVPIINDHGNVLLECLERDDCANGKIFEMSHYIAKCALDIICETALGKQINAQINDAKHKQYLDAVDGLCEILAYKSFKPWLRIPFIYKFTSYSRKEKEFTKIIKGFTLQVIQDRKEERKEKQHETVSGHPLTVSPVQETEGFYGRRKKTFLDLLLDVANETQQLTDKDIRDEVDTFMFGGHDTTAAHLGWSVLLLAMHPKCQQLVHKELDDIFTDNTTRNVTLEDISKMKYLDCCVKESLRLMPTVPFISRHISTDLKLDDGRIIPKDSTVLVLIYFIHRQAKHFQNPTEFQPERWTLNNQQEKRHPYSYIPFSAGPRNCIGQKFALIERKIVLAKLLRKYSIYTKETMESVLPVPHLVLQNANGVQVSLSRR